MTAGRDGSGAAPLGALTILTPVPAPWPLLPGYDRHAPDRAALREQLSSWAGREGWAGLSWAELIGQLTAAGRADVPLARLIEGHIDAVRILDQAGRRPEPEALYGVWASRSRRTGITVSPGPDPVLDGTLRFASGAGVVDRALVPVWTEDEHHLLLDLDVSGLEVDADGWTTAAMEVSRSHSIHLDHHPAPVGAEVGEVDFYLDRPAFFPGGVGVAACWLGATARVADLLLGWLHPPLSPAMEIRLGQVRTALAAAAATVRTGAEQLDDLLPLGRPAVRPEPADRLQLLSTEVRAVVGAAVEQILSEAHRLAGPAGLAQDRDLTRAVHDLQLYVLQQNADGDAAFLGRSRS